MTALVVVVAAGVGTYLFRISMLVLAARGRVPAALQHTVGFAVPAAFAALAAGSIVNAVHGGSGLAPVGAVAVAAIATRRFRSPLAALWAGMPALWLLTAVAAR